MSTIVVGIDGSVESREALRFAIAEAKLRSSALSVVHSWLFPYVALGPGIDPTIDTRTIENAKEHAVELIERELAEVADAAAGLEIKRVVVEGAPAACLIDAAADAQLLVVGSRGRGGFAGLLLGSVSQQCAHHAPCPVVIVPRPR